MRARLTRVAEAGVEVWAVVLSGAQHEMSSVQPRPCCGAIDQRYEMKCRLCNVDKPLIDAHIIPRSIYEEAKDGRDTHLIVVQNKPGTYPKKLPIGFYDNSILCSECDGRLGRFDEYGKKFIFGLEHNSEPVKSPDGKLVALKATNFDYTKLRLFFLSVLWRASVSRLESFSRVSLGKYESDVHKLIHRQDPGDPSMFPVFLTRFTGVNLRLTMMDPVWIRLGGDIRHYILYLIACNAYIKVDRRPARRSFQNLALNPDRPLYVVLRDYAASKEAAVFDAVVKIIQKM